ncbi:MAG: hypothetical protein AAGU18_10685 [Proteiniphilum sp.]
MKKDKLYHIIAGLVIGFTVAFWRPGEALFAAAAAGVVKELYDKYMKKSVADPLDTIATIFGGVLGVAASILLQNML